MSNLRAINSEKKNEYFAVCQCTIHARNIVSYVTLRIFRSWCELHDECTNRRVIYFLLQFRPFCPPAVSPDLTTRRWIDNLADLLTAI